MVMVMEVGRRLRELRKRDARGIFGGLSASGPAITRCISSR